MQAFFLLFKSPIFRGVVLAFAVAAIIGWAYMAVYGRGVAACERDHFAANAAAAEEQHQQYLAEVARGEELSAKLAKTQRRLDAKQTEYLTYAGAITGVCDPSLRMFVEYASGAKAGVPESSITPATTTAAESAADLAYQAEVTRAIGINVATNYARLDKCVAEFNAIIDWHRPKEAVTP